MKNLDQCKKQVKKIYITSEFNAKINNRVTTPEAFSFE